MNEIADEEDNQEWGLSMFGDQVRLIYYSLLLNVVFRVIESCVKICTLLMLFYRKLQHLRYLSISIVAVY